MTCPYCRESVLVEYDAALRRWECMVCGRFWQEAQHGLGEPDCRGADGRLGRVGYAPLGRVGLLAILGLWVAAGAAWAQTQVPNPPGNYKLVWDHDGVDVTSWELTIDGGTPVTVAATAYPTQAGSWMTPFPALTPAPTRCSCVRVIWPDVSRPRP